jgi:hypothetical protein
MKIKYLLIISTGLFLFLSQNSKAQILSPKLQEYEKNKVQIFTVQERDNLHTWFNEGIDTMDLTEDKKEEYYSIILYYFVKMGRLDDTDHENSKKEIEEKLDKLVIKQDAEIKEVLSEENYEIHLEKYGNLLKSIRNRISETEY